MKERSSPKGESEKRNTDTNESKQGNETIRITYDKNIKRVTAKLTY